MCDVIKESAKVVQEVAKTSREAIHATEKLGAYVAVLVKEPVDSIVGILADKLKFIRWQRQQRLQDKIKEIIKERKLEGKLNTIPLKFALPIVVNATIEEDDNLQDSWAKLLISAGNSNVENTVKVAFISILKQLDPIDACILNKCYQYAIRHLQQNKDKISFKSISHTTYHLNSKNAKPWHIPIEIDIFINNKAISNLSIFDNLTRLRLLANFIETDTIDVPDEEMNFSSYEFSLLNNNYYYLTPLGVSFIEACIYEDRELST